MPMRPLYDARIGDLGPGDFVSVEGICGHNELIPSSGLQQGLRLPPYTPVLNPRKAIPLPRM
jgi:hypothetical protein